MRTLTLTMLLALMGCRSGVKNGNGAVGDSGATDFTDNDGDGFGSDEDCDDGDASINAGATEVCDGVDNDCDGDVDEGVDGVFYTDADGDGFGDPDHPVVSCEAPDGTVPNAIDCDDTNADMYPGNNEICDYIDNNCDGDVDEGLVVTWWADSDDDGFGDPSTEVEDCNQPLETVDNNGDCDDDDPTVHPDAVEICNGKDDDCDGIVDGADAVDQDTWYVDGDGDGYGDAASPVTACDQPSTSVDDATDCDDGVFDVNPAAVEICNSIDDDCDGDIDDADSSVDLSTGSTWYTDSDSDTYGDATSPVTACAQPSGTVTDATDCDDGVTAVNPGATEVCNSIDDDCDGDIDDADSSVDLSTGSTWYTDSDSDTYGDATSPVTACAQPSGTVTDATDCDDGVTAVNPGATEVCNSIDDDCDGDIDDADSSVDLSTGSTWYTDSDSDGYGDATNPVTACVQPSTSVSDDTDCDDSTAAVNPGRSEICDGQDNDCDGNGDEMDGSAQACPAADCLDIMSYSPGIDGLYWMDAGGTSAYEVYCDLTTEGGGWTLAYVVSDDGITSWTWADRTLLGSDTTLVGSVTALASDMKSQAHHDILFEDLLFIHAPSAVTAEYESVGDGTMDLGSFIDSVASPNCDYGMDGNGYAQTGGTLTLGGSLCDTDLYFNLGDHEASIASCQALTSTWNHATYGPSWSLGNNNGCPFDDPSSSGLGPGNQCGNCATGTANTELRAIGFGSTLGLNTGSAGSAINRMDVYVR